MDYSPTDKQRLELDATRVAEGMMTYWLLEMSQRSVKGILKGLPKFRNPITEYFHSRHI